MHRRLFLSCFTLLLSSCAAQPWVPQRSADEPTAMTLVWVGTGVCERLVDGAWVRAPEFDYDFSVEQRREAGRWSSVKSLRRRHPGYDGSAGPRMATWFFELGVGSPGAQGVPLTITSSLGAGVGQTDRSFRKAQLELKADVSPMAPFDRYRISQDYHYEEGALDETVSLDNGATPWVRNVERATLFAKHAFPEPPTTR